MDVERQKHQSLYASVPECQSSAHSIKQHPEMTRKYTELDRGSVRTHDLGPNLICGWHLLKRYACMQLMYLSTIQEPVSKFITGLESECHL